MTKTKFLSAVDLFKPSINIIRDNLSPYFVLLVLPTLLIQIGEIAGDDSNGFSVFGFLGLVLSIAFIAPLTKLYLITAKGKNTTLNEAFEGSYKYFWRLIGLGILVGLIVVIGFILLIIPGLIMLRRYILSPFYLMDEDLSISEAMKKSAEKSKPYSWKIYEVLAVIFVIAMVSIFGALGVLISTILSLLYSLAIPLRYYEFKKVDRL